MTRICFVTDELYPCTSGGAGFLIYNSFLELSTQGHEISFLLDVDEEIYRQARDLFLRDVRGRRAEAVLHVDTLTSQENLPTPECLGGQYAWRSYRNYLALRNACRTRQFDIIEFNDFYGVAYSSLAAKLAGLALEGTTMAVRMHNPCEVLFKEGDAGPMRESIVELFGIERGSLNLAEFLLVPSMEYWEATAGYYDRDVQGKVEVSSPASTSFLYGPCCKNCRPMMSADGFSERPTPSPSLS